MKQSLYIFIILFSSINLNGQTLNSKLDNYLENELSKFKIPNVEILVVNKDSIIYSNSINGSTPNSIYYIGSVSKSLTALGILKLIEMGKITLDTKVVDLLPNLEFTNNSEEITVWHLLTHTGGIAKSSGFKNLLSLKEIKKTQYKIANKTILPLSHEYSNMNYVLLGLIIEEVTNLSYGDFMEKEVLAPLEMENTITGLRDEVSPNLINHYQYFGPFPFKSKQLDFSKYSIPAGFICSSSNDLGNYLKLNLAHGKFNDQQLIDSALLETMHTAWDKGDYGYAMGWKKGRYNDFKFYQHLGSTANSYSGIFLIPEKELGFVLLTNSNSLDFSENLAEGILNILTNGEPKETTKFEYVLRVLILLGYLFVIINFILKILKLFKDNQAYSTKKGITNIITYILITIGIFLLFPKMAQIPFMAFLKIQPDIGFLIILSIVCAVILELIKILKKKPANSIG